MPFTTAAPPNFARRESTAASVALSRAALTLRDQVAEFELNPVIVHADGSGLTVADALLTMKD